MAAGPLPGEAAPGGADDVGHELRAMNQNPSPSLDPRSNRFGKAWQDVGGPA